MEVLITPKLRVPIRKTLTQECAIHADGGSWSAREEHATCTLVVDSGWERETCSESGFTSQNGDAGIDNRLFTAGSCQWAVHAKSEDHWGRGAWVGFNIYMQEKMMQDQYGSEARADLVLNGTGDNQAVVDYPKAQLPAEATIIPGAWRYTVSIVDNSGNHFILTESNSSNPNIGSAIIDDDGKLTISLLTTFGLRFGA